VVVTGALTLVALAHLSDLAAISQNLAAQEVPEVHVMSRMRSLAIGLETDLLRVLLGPETGEDHAAQLAQTDAAMAKAIADQMQLHVASLPEWERRLIDEIAGQYEKLRVETAGMLALIEGGQTVAAAAVMSGPWRQLFAAFVESIERLVALETAQVNTAAETAAGLARAGRQRVAVLALLSTLLSLLVTVIVTRSIAAPVRSLVQATETVPRAVGSAPERQRGWDEIELLSGRFGAMKEAFHQLLEQQERFLADASHELGSPLAVIRGEAEVALRGANESVAPYKESLAIIAAQAGRMTRQVDDLLFLARARAGQVPYEMQAVDLAGLLEAVVRPWWTLAAARGVQLTLALAGSVTVWGDPRRLDELFTNLLDNAVKHTLPGGTVSLRLEEAGDWARVVVADTGVGMPAHDLPHIFERFYRIAAHRGLGADGNGLGLAISEAIARAHRGQIGVESVEGPGSCFTVSLRTEG
jgi:signal transduction histidine kinase